MRKFNYLIAVLALVGLSVSTFGCATIGGGQTVGPPLSNIVGKNVLVGIAPVLADQSMHYCNANAFQEYNASTMVCEGKLTAAVPLNFGSAIAAIQSLCQARGYSNSSNQLIVPEMATFGGCPVPPPLAPAAK